MRFLFLGNTNFSGLTQREHALAITLAKRGFRVTYIEGMPSFAAKVRHFVRSVSSPLAIERGADATSIPSTLEILTPPMAPTFSRSSVTPAFDRLLFRRWFKKIQRRFDWSETILFVSLPHWWTGFINADVLTQPFIVYDKCDSLLVPSRNAKTLRMMEEAEVRLIEDADLVTYSAHEMSTEFKQRAKGSEILFLPNAVSHEFIESLEKSNSSVYERMRVGFIGALDERWVDADLILESVSALRNVEHVFVGTISPRVQRKLTVHSNVTLMGALPHMEVARVVKSFDAAMIPFLQNEITRVVNPLKLYEYCCAGIPIVAMASKELRHYSEFVHLARTKEEFIQLLQNALKENDSKARESRIAFARANTWEQRVDSLLEAIQPKLSKARAR